MDPDTVDLLIKIFGPIITTAVGTALTILLARLAQRTGVEITAAQRQQVEKYVQNLILRVEEWARRQAPIDPNLASTIAQAKRRMFLDLLEQDRRAGLAPPTVTQEVALQAVDAELQKVRNPEIAAAAP